ncbi:MAG: hypothetical protein PHW12_09125 [Smithella sp.]|nr:hypothetical protein [Smithella sp.]
MDYKTFVATVIGHITWPCTVLAIITIFRKELMALAGLLTHAKIKDVEFWFRDGLDQSKSEADIQKIPRVSEDEMSSEREKVKNHPEDAVLEAWGSLEKAMYNKLKEKLPTGHPHLRKLTQDRADAIFSILGVLPPRTKKIVQNLQYMSYRIAKFQDERISSRDAWEYVVLAKRIQKSVEALSELPIIKLSPFTLLAMELNAAIDSGKYSSIGIAEVEKHLRDGSIFTFLKEKIGEDIDLSLLTSPDSCYPGFVEYYTERMDSMVNAYGGNEKRKWGIENQGLCLLLAWTIEIIQQGSGWHPPE